MKRFFFYQSSSSCLIQSCEWSFFVLGVASYCRQHLVTAAYTGWLRTAVDDCFQVWMTAHLWINSYDVDIVWKKQWWTYFSFNSIVFKLPHICLRKNIQWLPKTCAEKLTRHSVGPPTEREGVRSPRPALPICAMWLRLKISLLHLKQSTVDVGNPGFFMEFA